MGQAGRPREAMHHGPEMSSVSLLTQPSSITPTLTAARDEEVEGEQGLVRRAIGEGETRMGKEENRRERGERVCMYSTVCKCDCE